MCRKSGSCWSPDSLSNVRVHPGDEPRRTSGPGLGLYPLLSRRPPTCSHSPVSSFPDHSALYKAVEPTSVPPFSIPARNRALHAELVVRARRMPRDGVRIPTRDVFSGIDDEWTVLVESFLKQGRIRRCRRIGPNTSTHSGSRAAMGATSREGRILGWGRLPGAGQRACWPARVPSRKPRRKASLSTLWNIDVEVHMRIQGEDN